LQEFSQSLKFCKFSYGVLTPLAAWRLELHTGFAPDERAWQLAALAGVGKAFADYFFVKIDNLRGIVRLVRFVELGELVISLTGGTAGIR
jgi:hypothetical protein